MPKSVLHRSSRSPDAIAPCSYGAGDEDVQAAAAVVSEMVNRLRLHPELRASVTRATERARPVVAALAKPWLGAAAVFAGVFVVVTWPLAPRITHATYGGPGDGWALIWQTSQRFEDGLRFFSSVIEDDLAWPFGAEQTTAFLLTNIATELPNVGLLFLGVPDVLAYNLMVFAAALVSSLAMYGVVRRLGGRPSVAVWAGVAYLIVPWHLDRLAIHLTLSLTAALPLLVLGIVEWARRPGLRSGALVVLATVLAFHTHAYYGVAAACVLVGGLLTLILPAQSRRRPAVWQTAVLAGTLALVPLPLLVALELQTDSVSRQLQRPLYLSELAAHPHAAFLPSVHNPVFGGVVRGYVEQRGLPENTGELALYIGWTTVLLALIAVVAAARKRLARLPVVAALAVAGLGILLSLPAQVSLPLLGSVSTPTLYLQDFASGVISAPARFFILTITGLIIAAALGLESLARRLPRLWPVVLGAAFVLSAIELPVRPADRVVEAREPPQIVQRILELVPEGEPIAQYPSVERSLRPVADQLFWQRTHGHPLLNGAERGTLEELARSAVSDPTRTETAAALALLGFEWATYDPLSFVFVGSVPEALAYRPPPGFSLVRRNADGSMLLRVAAAPAAGFAARAHGFSPEGGQPHIQWLEGRYATLLVCATAPGPHQLSFEAGAFHADRRLLIAHDELVIPATDRIYRFEARVNLTSGWQSIPVRLIHSDPTRPMDVLPGSTDNRFISVRIGPIAVDGPSGPASLCRMHPARREG